jgi:hypothetical protein
MAGVGASMGDMGSSPERGRRGKGKRRQGRAAGGCHGRRGCHGEGLLGASWLLVAERDEKTASGKEKKRRRKERRKRKEKEKKKKKIWKKF